MKLNWINEVGLLEQKRAFGVIFTVQKDKDRYIFSIIIPLALAASIFAPSLFFIYHFYLINYHICNISEEVVSLFIMTSSVTI